MANTGQRHDRENSDGLLEKLVAVNRVAKVVKGGRIFGFTALTRGRRRRRQDWLRLRQGARSARCHPEVHGKSPPQHGHVELRDGTLWYAVKSSHARCSRIYMQPASEGTGVIAGGAMRAVLEAVGVRDVLAKSVGSNNPINLVRATIKGLQAIQSPESVAIKRGKSVDEIMANVG
jgi:small subunit ribosomal protein S5